MGVYYLIKIDSSSNKNISVRAPQRSDIDSSLRPPNRWTSVSGRSSKLYLYSAFFDRRNKKELKIIILAVGRPINSRVYCKFKNDSFPESLAEIQKNGRGHPINVSHMDQYFFICHANADNRPQYITIIDEELLKVRNKLNKINKEDNFLSIEDPPVRYPMVDVVVCVPVTYLRIDPSMLIQWSVALDSFHVDRVYVYLTSVVKETEQILKYFDKLHFFIVSEIPNLGSGISFDDVSLGSAISLNDCMIRNMHRSRYILYRL